MDNGPISMGILNETFIGSMWREIVLAEIMSMLNNFRWYVIDRSEVTITLSIDTLDGGSEIGEDGSDVVYVMTKDPTTHQPLAWTNAVFWTKNQTSRWRGSKEFPLKYQFYQRKKTVQLDGGMVWNKIETCWWYSSDYSAILTEASKTTGFVKHAMWLI